MLQAETKKMNSKDRKQKFAKFLIIDLEAILTHKVRKLHE